MPRRLHPTFADAVAIAVNPALVMALVGSLVFMLLEVFYQGDYEIRLQYIFALFVFAAVLVARISMEEGAERAAIFALPLAVVTLLALNRFVEYRGGPLAGLHWLINSALLGLVWWSRAPTDTRLDLRRQRRRARRRGTAGSRRLGAACRCAVRSGSPADTVSSGRCAQIALCTNWSRRNVPDGRRCGGPPAAPARDVGGLLLARRPATFRPGLDPLRRRPTLGATVCRHPVRCLPDQRPGTDAFHQFSRAPPLSPQPPTGNARRNRHRLDRRRLHPDPGHYRSVHSPSRAEQGIAATATSLARWVAGSSDDLKTSRWALGKDGKPEKDAGRSTPSHAQEGKSLPESRDGKEQGNGQAERASKDSGHKPVPGPDQTQPSDEHAGDQNANSQNANSQSANSGNRDEDRQHQPDQQSDKEESPSGQTDREEAGRPQGDEANGSRDESQPGPPGRPPQRTESPPNERQGSHPAEVVQKSMEPMQNAIRTVLQAAATLFRYAFFTALVLAAVILFWRQRRSVLEAVQRFIKTIRELLTRWFGWQRSMVASPDDRPAELTLTHPTFADFVDPFLSGVPRKSPRTNWFATALRPWKPGPETRETLAMPMKRRTSSPNDSPGTIRT